MRRGSPVVHEQPWKVPLPLPSAVEQSSGDLSKTLQEVGALGQDRPTPRPHHQSGFVHAGPGCVWIQDGATKTVFPTSFCYHENVP